MAERLSAAGFISRIFNQTLLFCLEFESRIFNFLKFVVNYLVTGCTVIVGSTLVDRLLQYGRTKLGSS